MLYAFLVTLTKSTFSPTNFYAECSKTLLSLQMQKGNFASATHTHCNDILLSQWTFTCAASC